MHLLQRVLLLLLLRLLYVPQLVLLLLLRLSWGCFWVDIGEAGDRRRCIFVDGPAAFYLSTTQYTEAIKLQHRSAAAAPAAPAAAVRCCWLLQVCVVAGRALWWLRKRWG